MVLKMEYILVLVLVLLIASILGINPSSKQAVNSKGDREVTFKSFELFELHKDVVAKRVSALEATKYTNYLDLKEINITDEKGNNVISKRAIYEDDVVFMKDEVSFKRSDGLQFSTENLTYELKKEYIKTLSSFNLKFNGHHIEGSNLDYKIGDREISADNVRATLLVAQ